MLALAEKSVSDLTDSDLTDSDDSDEAQDDFLEVVEVGLCSLLEVGETGGRGGPYTRRGCLLAG